MNRRALAWAGLLSLAALGAGPVAQAPHGTDMDYGPFLSYSVLKPGAGTAASTKPKDPAAPKPVAPAVKKEKPEVQPLPWKNGDLIAARGVTLKLGRDAAVCFDADTLRYAAGWTGGWLDVSHTHLASDKGSLPVAAVGTVAFTTGPGPGVSVDGTFADDRPNHDGPLPREKAHFRGIYRDGATTVFAYTAGQANVLDMPGCAGSENHVAFTRTIRVEASAAPLALHVCDAQADFVSVNASASESVQANRPEEPVTYVGLVGDAGGQLASQGRGVTLGIAPGDRPQQVTVVVARWTAGERASFRALLQSLKPAEDLTTHTHGGPALWKDTVETRGATGTEKDAYTVDTVALPTDNPWHAWMRPAAIDFFKDGRCAVVTWSGDVWIASNLDAKLDRVTWKRFATGLYDPLGCRVVDDKLYVLARDGIVKVQDLNGDGEADFYEYLGNDLPIGAQYNAFAMDLQSDAAGNFYYCVAGNGQFATNPAAGTMVKYNTAGGYSEAFATGLRTANGMGIGPGDFITAGDNQGNWVPSSLIWAVKQGDFLGFVYEVNRYTKAQRAQASAKHPKLEKMPLCYIPYQWDNSSGSQVWAGDRFGPLSGKMLHTSYGKSSIFEVLPEQVDGVWQGAVVRLPLNFESGIQRARVNPADGQVYVAGLRGWQTNGNKDGCLQRVRYTGKPCVLPTDLHVTDKGFRVTFPVDLDPEAAKDAGGYDVEVWNYLWSEKYGSDDYKPSAPGEKGRDPLEVKSVTLSADKRTVFIETPGIQPVQQYVLKIRINAADGGTVKCDLGGTVNELGR